MSLTLYENQMFQENFNDLSFSNKLYNNLRNKTRFVAISATLSATFTLILLLSSILTNISTIIVFSFISQIASVAFFYSSILFSVAFFIWVYSLVKTTRLLHFQHNYKPFMVVLFFFIPIINLFKPFIDMKNIWLKLKGENIGYGHYTILKFWWALFIISAIISKISWQFSLSLETFQDLVISLRLSTTALIINLAYCAITLLLVSDYWRKFKYFYSKTFMKAGNII